MHDVPPKASHGPRHFPRMHRGTVIRAGPLALGIAVAACGGPSAPGSANPAGGSGSQATGLAAYTSCMRAHGVAKYSPHPTSSVGTPKKTPQQQSLQQLGVTKSTFLAAQKACEQLLPATPGVSSALAPAADPFYRWSGSLTDDASGTILRTRTISFAAAAATTPVRAAQLLYVTTDELGHRTASVATVLQPKDKAASAATRLASYQAAYDALGARCDPSYTLQTGTSAAPILPYLAAGDSVVTADYEGEDLAEGAGQQYGYETLDAIRAAEKWLGAPEQSTPVGMVGYSGGSIATEFASELAHAYAPRLDIVGVAEGGLPVDPFHNLAYVDHPGSAWTWVIPVHLEGAARAFRISDLNKYLTPQGIASVIADEARCVGGFTGLTTKQMLKPQYQDIQKVPVFVRIFDHLIMSRAGTPRAPLFIGNGLSDSTGDGIMVTKDVQELAYTYCHRGVPVELHIYTGLDHQQAGQPFLDQAQVFLTQRFEKHPFQNDCAGIGPGNSIAPVPVPTS
jgi:Secretory lipase